MSFMYLTIYWHSLRGLGVCVNRVFVAVAGEVVMPHDRELLAFGAICRYSENTVPSFQSLNYCYYLIVNFLLLCT
jgi:hypothetical protein